jgi:DNA-binding NtrC family response regulator
MAWLPRDLIKDERPKPKEEFSISTAPAVSASAAIQIPAGFVLPESGIELEEVELSFVRQAMERSGGNQTRAAELLGISRDQLRYRLKKIEDIHATD